MLKNRNAKSPLDDNPLAYLTQEDLHGLSFHRLADLLSVIPIRHLITQRRWAAFLQSGAEMQVHGSVEPGIFKETVAHNIQGIKNSVPALASLMRSELVLRPVMCLDHIYSYRDLSVFPHVSVLLVGPRTEFEIMTALAYGILPANLHAVDLITYSPWIAPGDMHALPYPDNSFDVVILGWVLNYSNTPLKVASEIARVCKPGAVVSIGNDCNTREAIQGSKFQYYDKPQTMAELLRCFDGSVGKVYFSHEPDYRKGDLPGFTGHLIGTFEITK